MGQEYFTPTDLLKERKCLLGGFGAASMSMKSR